MRIPFCLALFLLLSLSAPGQVTPSLASQTVEFTSGRLRLKAYFWKPAGRGPFPAVLFNHGSGGADPDHTAGMPITQSANELAPFFIKHGYAFLYPLRRGHGPSASQARFNTLTTTGKDHRSVRAGYLKRVSLELNDVAMTSHFPPVKLYKPEISTLLRECASPRTQLTEPR